MRVLLIGGNGFIGPQVASELLRTGHDVSSFQRSDRSARLPSGVRVVLGDRQRLSEARAELVGLKPDVVIDLILSSGRQARELMAVFRGVAKRVVALSSMDVYRACGVLNGLEPGGLEPLPLSESSALRSVPAYPPDRIVALRTVFGWLDSEYDKIPVEQAILGDPELPGTVLRLPMVYGPGDRLHRFLPLVQRIRDGRRAFLFSEQVAEWRGTRGFVENVAAAIALAALSDRAAGRVYNVGDLDAPSELEWARLVLAAAGHEAELVCAPDASVPPYLKASGNTEQHWVTDTARLRDELGYREPVSREEALHRTTMWELEQLHDREGVPFDYSLEDAVIRQTFGKAPQ
jgi:nucleoside-diphosphate-sugar epimerase